MSDDEDQYDQYDDNDCKTTVIDQEVTERIKTIVLHIFFKCDSRNMGQVKYVAARPFLIEGFKKMHKPQGKNLEQAELNLKSMFPPLD